MKIYSIRERPELMPLVEQTLRENWWDCMPWTKRHMRDCMAAIGPIPDTFVAVEDGEVVGLYTLAIKTILYTDSCGLWIATLYVDPKHRGKHLSPILIEDARRRGGEMGFQKIFLASDHMNYYEKYGFYEIGPDACAWGEPVKMYENTTLPPKGERAA